MSNTQALSERRARASKVAAAFAENDNVAGVLLAGSVARGLADDLSDIEVDVFWQVPPTDEDRRTPLETNGWQLVATDVDEHEWADSFLVEGIKVDTSQFLVTTLDAWIDRVVHTGDTEPEYQVRISAIRDGQPLHEPDLIDAWRARTEPYPEVLRHAMVDQGLDMWPRARVDMLAARDDVILLHSDLVDNLQGILDVLMGLNGIYAPHPWHKWLDHETGLLAITPTDLNGRIRHLLRADSTTAANEATALVHETLDLVDQHLPEFDTTKRRRSFDERRVVARTSL
jgi:predicted nucleotidyltransferase